MVKEDKVTYMGKEVYAVWSEHDPWGDFNEKDILIRYVAGNENDIRTYVDATYNRPRIVLIKITNVEFVEPKKAKKIRELEEIIGDAKTELDKVKKGQ